MKLAHLILAHKSPEQVKRLAQSLHHDDVHSWLHWDKKTSTSESFLPNCSALLFPVQPAVSVHWAGFSVVKAMINAMKCAANSGFQYDYYNFLSGQCYPIRDQTQFLQYLNQHAGAIFIGSRPVGESEENVRRVTKYYLNDFRFPGKRVVEKTLNFGLPDRKPPFGFTVTKGPQWMTVPADAVDYILWFLRTKPAYTRFFATVHCPDELFFQTILFNSPFRERMKEQVFHFTDWSEMKRSPKVLTIEDRFRISENPLLFFARKFDIDTDSEILDYLDQKIKKEQCLTANI